MQVSISQFADKLMDIIPVIADEFVQRHSRAFYECKITFPQAVVLHYIYKSGEAKMSEMAKYIKVTQAAMTGVVTRLVKGNYVLRVYDPKDRRIIKIKLTDKGAKTIEKMQEQKKEMIMHLFGKVSAKDRDDYLRILSSIRDILMKEKTEFKQDA
ncbi:MAG: MarR family transcriptional regulator [Candidatus Omnitrophica bacterium]|nr:MarR family transcriptional regulator [Candidatus Omnitrophota bacterium]